MENAFDGLTSRLDTAKKKKSVCLRIYQQKLQKLKSKENKV